MCSGELVFAGAARIFLEGQEALFPDNAPYARSMKYSVGADPSPITVVDHRARPVWAAQRALEGSSRVNFALEFNRDAWVQIRECAYCVEIELDESPQDGVTPILWLGVVEGDAPPARSRVWDVVFDLNDNLATFATVVESGQTRQAQIEGA